MSLTTLTLLLAILAMINLSDGWYYGPQWYGHFDDTVVKGISCVEKCKNNKSFNIGYVDSSGYCRCYDTGDVFYYVYLKYTKPDVSIDRCKNPQMTKECANQCHMRNGWQSGYCYQPDFCECYNKDGQSGVFYLMNVRHQ